ncbi:MAG: hypothetical protein AB1705_17570 [Verrucomicrobiota bacterium]
MQIQERAAPLTLARRLGDTTHESGLLRRVRAMSGAPERAGEWLLKCAVQRGATHYQREFDPALPPDNPALTDEELGVALCLGHHEYNPAYIRAAAQLLSSPRIDPKRLALLAEMERVEPMLLHIAKACEGVAPTMEPWATLRQTLAPRRTVHTDALPHWTRFAILQGLTRTGMTAPVWLARDE